MGCQQILFELDYSNSQINDFFLKVKAGMTRDFKF